MAKRKEVDRKQPDQPLRPNRREVIAGVAGMIAAAVAKAGPEKAEAGDLDPLVLGVRNEASSSTQLVQQSPLPPEQSMLVVASGPGASAFVETAATVPSALLGVADQTTGIRGLCGPQSFVGTVSITAVPAGVLGMGESLAPSSGVGVLGIPVPGVSSGAGILGLAAPQAMASGVTITALANAGVVGVSETTTGIIGISMPSAYVGSVTSTAQPVGVSGVVVQGCGVRGVALDQTGVAVSAENLGNGTALRVIGATELSTGGCGEIPIGGPGVKSHAVDDPTVTESSHIMVTFTVEPTPRNLRIRYIERQPGVGFVMYFSGRVKTPISFTYLILEVPC